MSSYIDVSIVIVTFNSKNYLKNCLNSIFNQDSSKYSFEVIIVDNSSSDGTIDLLNAHFPEVKIIENRINKGYGYANNLGVKYAKGHYIILMNPDTVTENRFFNGVIKPLENNKNIITTPKVLVFDGKLINSCGLIIHFTGLGFTRGYKRPRNDFCKEEQVSGIFGCCFALRKTDFINLGGFDENIFLYGEDTDFSWNANLKGYSILFTPEAVLKHDYTLKVPPEKIYYLETSRYLILRKYFSKSDFLILLPSLIITEILTFSYALKFGFKGLKYKIISIKDGMTSKALKIEGNKEKLIDTLETEIPTDQLTYNRSQKFLKKIINYIFHLNWILYKALFKRGLI